MSIAMLLRSVGGAQRWTWFASLGFFAFLQQFIPHQYTDVLLRNLRLWLQSLTPYVFCDVHEFDSSNINTLYPDVEIYLSSLTAEAAHRLNLFKAKNAKALTFTMANDQRTEDRFDNVKVEWVRKVYDRQRPVWAGRYEYQSDEKRTFTLHLWRKDKPILPKYIAHIQARAKELKRAARDLLLYTNSKGRDPYFSRNRPWESVNFIHPATFDTLALDGDLKTQICEDLDKFSQGQAYYRRVGKPWKRGYLLYGPPGTGKSSMIAAIANKMRYDVYDLELTEVESNIELRKLLLHTSNKSVIVIEDIDCSLDLSGQRKKKKKQRRSDEPNPDNPTPTKQEKEQSKVTLSGLLNFVDGLWSCCGSERIFIFTTNYIEKLDPALLRAGRMDMHIHLSYCTFSAFQMLAKNYLEISDHELFHSLRTSFEGSYMTPASVAEVLIKNQDFPTAALESLLSALNEHRVKPKPPTPDSDDEKEDEKDAAKSAGAAASVNDENLQVTTTITADEAVKTATESTQPKKEEPIQSSTGEKQIPLGNKIHPTEDPVKIPGANIAAENGNAEGGTEFSDTDLPRDAANGGTAPLAGSRDTSVVENGHGSVHQDSNGVVLVSSGGKKNVALDGNAVSNGTVGKEVEVGGASEDEKGGRDADAAAAPHSNGSVEKVVQQKGAVVDGSDNRSLVGAG